MKRPTRKGAGASSYDGLISLARWLRALSSRDSRPLWAWKHELEIALASRTELKSLTDRLEKVEIPEDPEQSSFAIEMMLGTTLSQIADAAARIVENIPSPSSPDDAVQYRIKQAVDEAIFVRFRLFWPIAI